MRVFLHNMPNPGPGRHVFYYTVAEEDIGWRYSMDNNGKISHSERTNILRLVFVVEDQGRTFTSFYPKVN